MIGGLLVSYHYLREVLTKDPARTTRHLVKVVGKSIPKVLDSGAYSASTSGVPVPLLEFGRFIRSHGHWYTWVASLDVIGDPDRTLSNWRALIREYPVVPTVHLLTPLHYLDHYLDQGVERMAIGGMVGNRRLGDPDSPEGQWIQEALDRCAARQVPVHGFGVTSRKVLDLYGWDSVDSTTAVRNAMFRMVLMPDPEKGYRVATEADLDPREAALLLGEWEVVHGAGRRARLRRNTRVLMEALETTGVRTVYHAITPNKVDEVSVRQGILDHNGGRR